MKKKEDWGEYKREVNGCDWSIQYHCYSTYTCSAIGFQIGASDAFDGPHLINTFHLDGVSVTHGSPRQHIWSFVTGLDEGKDFSQSTCPCVAENTNGNTNPSFVGQNYFCESSVTGWNREYVFFPDGDPLWDGQGCGPTSSCCTFNSPPWFNVWLPSPTTDDIEVRICGDEGIEEEDSLIQLIELYVKWIGHDLTLQAN